MKPYSEDLRRRALAAVAAGRARVEVVALFGVSLASLKRWLARQRAGQPLAAKRGRPGPAPRLGERELAALRAQLVADPDAGLARHAQRWQAAGGAALSVATFSRAWARLGWTHKKRRSSPASATSRSAPTGGSNRPT